MAAPVDKGVLCTAKKKGGGGGERKRAVSPQCEVCLKMATADFAIMRLTAQAHCKICIFFKRGAKNFKKRGKCTKKKSDPKSPGLPWRCGGRLGVQMSAQGECEPQTGQKTSTASKATLSICLMRTKLVASSPICKSSVVDLVMSRDHQNDNAVWLCRFSKKKWSKKGHGAERIWTDDHSLQSQRSTTSAISESPNACEKTSIESCTWPLRSARFSVRKRCVVCFWLNLTKSKCSLFRLSNNLCCHWCWSLCSRNYPNPSKNTKSDPKSLTRIA